jgi:hypothetical protein
MILIASIAIALASKHPDAVLLIVGLLVSLGGAWWTASAVVIDWKTAGQLPATRWDSNPELK